MDVLLIRHATAIPAVGMMRDEDRYLTDDGRATALAVGKKLRELGFAPDVVYTSPLVRAVQTAELVSVALAPKRVVSHVPLSIDEGSVSQVLAVLEKHADHEAVVLVTHEPKVRAIAAALAKTRDFPGFQTAGVAGFKGPANATRLSFRLDPATMRVDESKLR